MMKFIPSDERKVFWNKQIVQMEDKNLIQLVRMAQVQG
jgi:hypothetical protein